MTVITISRQFCSGGDEIAFRAAQKLGYALFEQQMYIEAAREIKLGNRLAWMNLSEDKYQLKSFLAWLISGSFNPQNCATPEECAELETQNLVMLKQALRRAAQAGNVVIVGRGAQVVLRNHPCAVHIRIVSSTETRIWQTINRVRECYYSEEMADRQHEYDTAWDLMMERDAAYAEYLRHYFDADENDSSLYDLVINCQETNTQQAVEKIVRLVHRIGEKDIKETKPVMAPGAGIRINH